MYAADHEPEAEDDPLSQAMNDASMLLAGESAQCLFDNLRTSDSTGESHFPTMVIAPLAGSPASGPPPLLLTPIRKHQLTE